MSDPDDVGFDPNAPDNDNGGDALSQLGQVVGNPNERLSHNSPMPLAGRGRTKPISAPGLAGFTVGAFGCLLNWVPSFRSTALPLSMIGLLLCGVGLIVSLIGRRSRAGIAFVGMVVCLCAAVISIKPTSGDFTAWTEGLHSIITLPSQPPIKPAIVLVQGPATRPPVGGVGTPNATFATVSPQNISIDAQIAAARSSLDAAIQAQRDAERADGASGPKALTAEHNHIAAQETLDQLMAVADRQKQIESAPSAISAPLSGGPDVSAIAKEQVQTNDADQPQGPTTEQFSVFCDGFVKEWVRSSTASMAQAMRGDETPPKFACRVVGIDKKRTDSLLHPSVWVLVASESMTSDGNGGFCEYRDTFNFYWDGRRWVGLESTSKKVFPTSDSEPGKENEWNAKLVDDDAIACQK